MHSGQASFPRVPRHPSATLSSQACPLMSRKSRARAPPQGGGGLTMLAAPPVFKWPKSSNGARAIVSPNPIGIIGTRLLLGPRPPDTPIFTQGSFSPFQTRRWRFTCAICCLCRFASGSVSHPGPCCSLWRLRASMRAVPPRKLRMPRVAEMMTCGATERGTKARPLVCVRRTYSGGPRGKLPCASGARTVRKRGRYAYPPFYVRHGCGTT